MPRKSVERRTHLSRPGVNARVLERTRARTQNGLERKRTRARSSRTGDGLDPRRKNLRGFNQPGASSSVIRLEGHRDATSTSRWIWNRTDEKVREHSREHSREQEREQEREHGNEHGRRPTYSSSTAVRTRVSCLGRRPEGCWTETEWRSCTGSAPHAPRSQGALSRARHDTPGSRAAQPAKAQ